MFFPGNLELLPPYRNLHFVLLIIKKTLKEERRIITWELLTKIGSQSIGRVKKGQVMLWNPALRGLAGPSFKQRDINPLETI
jgi:hypothetical protein